MIAWVGRGALAALFMMAPAIAAAGDGTFGVPPSGILLPPPPQPQPILRPTTSKSAALIPPERAAPERQRPVQKVQQTYQPAPAEGAGRSRAVPPSEAPVHSPIITPPKSKQFKAPVATLDPSYVERTEGDAGAEPEPVELPPSMRQPPVVAQGAAPEQKRGLFGLFRRNTQPQQAQAVPMQVAPVYTSAASAAYQEHAVVPAPASAPARAAYASYAAQPAPQPARSRLSFGGSNPSARAKDGTPCAQLRGLFTSPPECR